MPESAVAGRTPVGPHDQHIARALMQAGFITPQQIHAAAQRRTAAKDLGEVLVEMGFVSREQLSRVTGGAGRGGSEARHERAPAPATDRHGGHAPSRASSPGPVDQGGRPADSAGPDVGLGHDAMPYFDSSGVLLEDDDQQAEDAEIAPAIRTCNELIQTALAMRASDLHLEPLENGLLPRFRVDGQLRSGRVVPAELQLSVISRLKLMARMNITETRLSQDGRFRATVGGRLYDFRVSSLPGVRGEKVVIRILDPASLVTDLSRLGFTEGIRNSFEEMLKRAHGMILVTGPTGSGKTTTLYAALATTRDETKNVVTVEDPVEYEMKGIMQCDVNTEIGNTFAARLRSILRQDPDVILIGEIRDTETAEMAVRAALTGHLVLSTLHTNSAAAAVTRLQDMGLESFLIASSLTGVLAQRLVRMICRHCREPMDQDSSEYELAVAQWHLQPGTPLFHGAGCKECKGLGLRGRIAIMEWLVIDKEMRSAIMTREDADSLHRIAVQHGMKTLYEDGLDKLKRGHTTSGELARIFLAAQDPVTAPAAQ